MEKLYSPLSFLARVSLCTPITFGLFYRTLTSLNHRMASLSSLSSSSIETKTTKHSLPPSYQCSTGFAALHIHPVIRKYKIKIPDIASTTEEPLEGAAVVTAGEQSTVVHEVMAECVANNLIPAKLLAVWLTDLKALRQLITQPFNDQDMAQRDQTDVAFLTSLENTISVMDENFELIRDSSIRFKTSRDKDQINKAFLPTNLHLQSVSIKSVNASQTSFNRQDITTVGAFTAQHTQEGDTGLESLWRTFARSSLVPEEQTRSASEENTECRGFVGYPHLMWDFKKTLTLANAISKLSASSNIDDYRFIEALLAPLRGCLREGTLTASRISEISSVVRRYVREVFEPHGSKALNLFLRESIVMSQMITATVSAVLTEFYATDREFDSVIVRRLEKHGLLMYYESLLSEWVDEKVMMEDIIGGLELLREIVFVIPVSESAQVLDVSAQLEVRTLEDGGTEIFLPPLCLKSSTTGTLNCDPRMDPNIRFKIYPVFLNIGINEAASLAARQGKIILQKAVNKYYGDKLLAYSRDMGNMESTVIKARAEFAEIMSSTVGKNVTLLHCAQALTRLHAGLRITMCKSAKDRTAMAVTLEQVNLLQQIQSGLSVAEYDRILTDMRRNGTRRENTVKNIGFARYAFIQEQVEQLPPIYQPPPGTYGKSET